MGWLLTYQQGSPFWYGRDRLYPQLVITWHCYRRIAGRSLSPHFAGATADQRQTCLCAGNEEVEDPIESFPFSEVKTLHLEIEGSKDHQAIPISIKMQRLSFPRYIRTQIKPVVSGSHRDIAD